MQQAQPGPRKGCHTVIRAGIVVGARGSRAPYVLAVVYNLDGKHNCHPPLASAPPAISLTEVVLCSPVVGLRLAHLIGRRTGNILTGL